MQQENMVIAMASHGQEENPSLASDFVAESILAKQRRSRSGKTSGLRIAFREVGAVLRHDDDTHHNVLVVFRRAGGSTDRWNRTDMARMAAAITAEEDRLEMLRPNGRRDALRLELREVRRRLEDGAEG